MSEKCHVILEWSLKCWWNWHLGGCRRCRGLLLCRWNDEVIVVLEESFVVLDEARDIRTIQYNIELKCLHMSVFFNLFQVAESSKHYWAFCRTKILKIVLSNSNLRILKELCKEWAELLGSAELRLKNTSWSTYQIFTVYSSGVQ